MGGRTESGDRRTSASFDGRTVPPPPVSGEGRSRGRIEMNEGQLDIWFFAIVDSLAFRVVCYWGNLCSNFLQRGNGGRGGNGQDGKAKLISSSFLSSFSSWSSSCAQLPTAFLMGGSTQSPKEKRENFIFGRGVACHTSHTRVEHSNRRPRRKEKGKKQYRISSPPSPFPHISRSDGKIKKVKQDLQYYFPFDFGEEDAKNNDKK